jgi:hypothetical protein
LQVVRVLVGNSLQNRAHEVRAVLVAVQTYPRAPHGGIVREQTPVEVWHEQETLGASPNLSCLGRQLVEVWLVDLLARRGERFSQPAEERPAGEKGEWDPLSRDGATHGDERPVPDVGPKLVGGGGEHGGRPGHVKQLPRPNKTGSQCPGGGVAESGGDRGAFP